MKTISSTQEHVVVQLTQLELLILNNSLNEVCNAMHISEFHPRIGAERAVVRKLLTLIGKAYDQLAANSNKKLSA